MSNPTNDSWCLTTRLVHEGERQPIVGTPTATPIYTSVSYGYEAATQLDEMFASGSGYTYARHGNPTVAALEQVIAVAEGARGVVAFGSGMAALHTALLAAGTPRGATAPAVRSILASQDLYGTTLNLIETFFATQGASIRYADASDTAAFTAAIAEARPEVVLVEQISNPLLKVIDVEALAQATHAVGARLIVDSTLATPILQRPLTLGADLVVHSATKYLGGHCSATAGVVAARTGMLADTMRRYAILLGPLLGPFEAHTIALGVKTLALRVRQQCANAARLAAWLAEQQHVAHVYYPGLPTHPQHERARQVFGGLFGAIVSFDLQTTTRSSLYSFLDALRLIVPVTSLGDVYSLATAPALTSHRDLSPEQRAQQGIGDNMIRLSVGIEEADDLIADLAQALERVKIED